MAFRVVLKPSAEKAFAKLPRPARLRLLAVLAVLQRDPWRGKKLAGKYRGLYSLRVWPYRIIYIIIRQELLVIIIRIGHRQGVY